MYAIAQRSVAPAPAAGELAKTLAQAHEFSFDALASNRAGRLAPEQLSALCRRAKRKLLLGTLVVVGALLFAAAVGFAEGRQVFAQMLLFSGIIALGGGQLIALGLRSLRDARSGAVATLAGAVVKGSSVDVDAAGNSTRMYYYYVGQQKFRVSFAAYAALPAGASCRLYYSPQSKQLLSIEPLPAPAA